MERLGVDSYRQQQNNCSGMNFGERIDSMCSGFTENANSLAEDALSKAQERGEELYTATIENTSSKLDEEEARHAKDIGNELKIKEAQIQNGVKLEILKAQTEAIHESLAEAITRLNAFSEGPEYPELLKNLIAEGFDRLKESKVRLMIRKKDLQLAQQVLPEAVKIAQDKNPGLIIKAKIEEGRFLAAPPHCAGGVQLICQKGKVRVSNTLNDRLKLAYEGMLPQLRHVIIPHEEGAM